MMKHRQESIGRTNALSGMLLVGCLLAVSAAPLPAHGLADAAPLAIDDDEPVELTLTKLMAATYEPGRPLDKEIAELDGKKVKISGLMALGTLEGQETFELTSDACGCGQSKVNHFVKVTLVEETTHYIPSEIIVTGTFEASEEIVDGFVVSVYRITADEIEE